MTPSTLRGGARLCEWIGIVSPGVQQLAQHRKATAQVGHSLLELVAAVALSAVVAMSAAAGARTFASAARLEAARVTTALAALTSRRIAYTTDAPVRLSARAGASALTATDADGTTMLFPLPSKTRVASATAGGVVRFRPGGRGGNATITLTVDDTDATAHVVVNQRGSVR